MPSKISLIEKERGRPLPDVLRELYARHGSQAAVAAELGVSQGTVSLWLMRYGLKTRKLLTKGKAL